MEQKRSRAGCLATLIVLAAAITLGVLCWKRYATFHNETFDLAFYARIAWGMCVGDFYEPMLDTSISGLHWAWVLVPLGWIGRLAGMVPTLIVAQTLAFFATGVALARFAERKISPKTGWIAALAWCAYPNLSHVFTYEFHPGNLALPFFVTAIDAIDRKAHKHALVASVLALLCREDLALVLVPLALVGLWTSRSEASARKSYGAFVALASAYFAYFLLVAQPAHAPAQGSLSLHFGSWGRSVGQMLRFVLTHPAELIAHLSQNGRPGYVLQILLPVAVLPAVLGMRWLLPALPIVIVNLLSHFPGTTGLDSHYLTPAVPFVIAAMIEGLSRLPWKFGAWIPVSLASAATAFLFGAYPFSRGFDEGKFTPDARSVAAAQAVAQVPRNASVQAPYALLPHLAERKIVRRGPPPDLATDVVILDAWQREQYLHDEHLIRTDEEPVTRDWMAKPRRVLVAAPGNYLVLKRGNPREGFGALRSIVGTVDPQSGQTLTRCLGLLGSRVDRDALVLDLAVREPCASDLAMRIGEGDRPRRVDLLFDGLFSPAHLRAGDRVRSRHELSVEELRAYRARRFRLGLIRQSGARPDSWDANSIPLLP